MKVETLLTLIYLLLIMIMLVLPGCPEQELRQQYLKQMSEDLRVIRQQLETKPAEAKP